MKVVSISCARAHGRQPAVYGSQSSSLSDMFGGIVRRVFFFLFEFYQQASEIPSIAQE